MLPFLILILLSVFGIVRVLVLFDRMQLVSMLILLFWLLRNLYILILCVFLADGRDSDTEPVYVVDAEPVSGAVGSGEGETRCGVTTQMTEHSLTVFLDEGQSLDIGAQVSVSIPREGGAVELGGVVTGIRESRGGGIRTQTIEILDFRDNWNEYLQVLFDRVPTLPQALHNDFGVLSHLWQNIAHRVARTAK